MAGATSSPPGFRIGPLTHYADVEQMEAWLEAAAPGELLIYATGPALADHPAAQLARKWQKLGQVDLFQARSPSRPNCFDYTARKRAELSAAAARPAAPAEILPGEALRVLELLTAVADAGEPCPTNEAIAQALGLGTRWKARHLFDRLVIAGRIRVVEPARFGARVIEIVATGARTAAQAGERRRA